MRKLTWYRGPFPVPEVEIDELEVAIGRKLPGDYREFMTRYGAGRPDETEFDFERDGEIAHGGADQFFRVGEEILSHLQHQDLFPEDLVPFAQDGGGNLVCFDYRVPGRTEIVWWDHEAGGIDEEIFFVAKTFTDFLELLHLPPDDDEE